MKVRGTEACSEEWENLYSRGHTPWRSGGLTKLTQELLAAHCTGNRLLEIGCGAGEDALLLQSLGFEYCGLDFSRAATEHTRAQLSKVGAAEVHCTDFFRWQPNRSFDIIYEKGVFHGLAGVRRRVSFIKRVAKLLGPNGIWMTVSGAADKRRSDFNHGAIYLRDLISPAEPFFEVLHVAKGPYGLVEFNQDFLAWHALFRRR